MRRHCPDSNPRPRRLEPCRLPTDLPCMNDTYPFFNSYLRVGGHPPFCLLNFN